MTVLFRCGHSWPFSARTDDRPQCPCGETVIVRSNAPAPRIRGVASGPHVTTVALEPITVSLGTQALKLKEIEDVG